MDSPGSPQKPDAPRPSALPPPRNGRPPRAQADDKMEHYTLDEMMSRLRKSSSSGSGRRRRSSQSGASSKPAPRPTPAVATDGGLSRAVKWTIGCGIVLLLLTLAGIFGYRTLIRLRVEGDNFRANAARRITELLGRRVQLETVRLEHEGVISTNSLTVIPQPQDFLESVSLNNVHASLSSGSWMGKDWDVTSLRFRGARLEFNANKPPVPENIWTMTSVGPAREGVGGEGFRFGITAEPENVSVRGGRFDDLTLAWRGPQGQPETLSGLEGSFQLQGNLLEVSTIQGTLATSYFPPMPVSRFNARLVGTTLQILAADVLMDGSHPARLAGKAELTPEGSLELTGPVSGVQLKGILPSEWKEKVLGQFNSTGVSWMSHFKSGPPPELKGPFQIRGLVLRSMPFIEKISTVLQMPELTQYEFPEFSGEFSWTPRGTRLTALRGESPGMVRLSGEVEVAPGGLVNGVLKVEIHAQMLARVGGVVPAGFTPSPEPGWSGVEFRITGTALGLTDNLVVVNPTRGQGPVTTPARSSPAAPARPTPPPSSLPSGFDQLPSLLDSNGTNQDAERLFNELTR